jgi:hypothetical protein
MVCVSLGNLKSHVSDLRHSTFFVRRYPMNILLKAMAIRRPPSMWGNIVGSLLLSEQASS